MYRLHLIFLPDVVFPRTEHTGFMGLLVEYRYGQVHVVKFPILSYCQCILWYVVTDLTVLYEMIIICLL